MESQRSTVVLQEFLANPKNREAFGSFAKKYHLRIKRCCIGRGLQDADAEDLTANILLRFCERDVFDGFVFQSKPKFYAWLDSVARNAVLTFVRDRGRKPDAWSVGNPDAQESLQKAAKAVMNDLESIYADTQVRIQQARAAVKARVEDHTWQVFVMLVDNEQTVEAATQELAMSKEAVWKALSRVKRLLREELRHLHDPADSS